MSKKVPAWQRNGWKKPGPKAPHSANYVKAKDAKHMKTGLRQPGQWVENIDDSRPSRVLFTDSAEDRNGFRPVSIHLHPGDERRARCHSVPESTQSCEAGQASVRRTTTGSHVDQKQPEQFPVHALERVVRILQGVSPR